MPQILPTREFISVQTGMMGSLGHLKVISHDSLWCYLGVGIIQSKLLIFLHLLSNLEILKVVLVLGNPQFYSQNLRHILVGKAKSVLIVVPRRRKKAK